LKPDFEEKKTGTPIWLNYLQKNFHPERSSRFGEKKGKRFSVTQKRILRKTPFF
jgi:hypothetical protein